MPSSLQGLLAIEMPYTLLLSYKSKHLRREVTRQHDFSTLATRVSTRTHVTGQASTWFIMIQNSLTRVENRYQFESRCIVGNAIAHVTQAVVRGLIGVEVHHDQKKAARSIAV